MSHDDDDPAMRIETWQDHENYLADKNVISCWEVSVQSPADCDTNYRLSLQVLLAAVLAVSQVAQSSPVGPPAPYPVEAYPDIAPNYNVSQNSIYPLRQKPSSQYLGAMPSSIMFEYISTTNRWMYQNIWQAHKT